MSSVRKYFLLCVASCFLFPVGKGLAQESAETPENAPQSTPKNDRELSQALISSANPDERNLGYLIKFVSESASLSGATSLCDEGEYHVYMACAGSVLGRWPTLMKRGMPDVSLKGQSSQQVIMHMWQEQEKAVRNRIGKPSPQLCEDILSREHKSRIWGFCDHDKLEEKIKSGTPLDDSSSTGEGASEGDAPSLSPNSTLQ